MGIFPVFRRSNPDGPRVKVNPCIAGYVWVAIFWSFFKLREVEVPCFNMEIETGHCGLRDVFRFYCVFWYHSYSMTNGTKNGSWP